MDWSRALSCSPATSERGVYRSTYGCGQSVGSLRLARSGPGRRDRAEPADRRIVRVADANDETDPAEASKALLRLHAQGRLLRLPKTKQAPPAPIQPQDGSMPLSEVLQQLREDRGLPR